MPGTRTAYQMPGENASGNGNEGDGRLRYIPLGRREEGGWTPLRKLAGNLPESATADAVALSCAYWAGYAAGWEELAEAVQDGQGVAVLPEASGIVVLDLDVRWDWIVGEGGIARLERVEDGIEDLKRAAGAYEFVIERTYTVRTPSGGLHLYYRRPREARCDVRSRGHRTGWCVDVKASRNVWAVAPPTPGYEVVCASQVRDMDYMMARHLADLGRRTPVREGSGEVRERGKGGGIAGRTMILEAIERAAGMRKGGKWNESLFWTACRYGEEGMSDEETLRDLMAAARPWNASEGRRARATILSGLRHGRAGAGREA